MTATITPATICYKCGGTGELSQFVSRDNGRCWTCKGYGSIGTSEQRALLKKQRTEEALAAEVERLIEHRLAILTLLLGEADTGRTLPQSTHAAVDDLVSQDCLTPAQAGRIRACIQ